MGSYGNYPNPDLCKKYGKHWICETPCKYNCDMGCPGCLLSAREAQEQMETITKMAKDDAIRQQKIMVLYWLSDRQVGYIEKEAAKAAGITPIKYISWMQPVANGPIP